MLNTCSPQRFIDLNSESTYPYSFNFFEGRNCLDSMESYNENIKIKPSNWHYSSNPVTYTVNSQRYRCNSFDKIEWSNSIVILGCSHVFGVGVDDADTVSSQLQNLCGFNVVNLGVNGASQHFNIYNMVLLKNHGINPKAYIHVWPDSRRTLIIDSVDNIKTGGPWNNFGLPEEYSYTKLFYDQKTHINFFAFNMMISNLLAGNVPIVHATLSLNDMKTQSKDSGLQFFPILDHARDDKHPGPRSHKIMAEAINQRLKAL